MLSLLPLIGLSFYTWVKMDQAGLSIVESSRKALINNSMSLLEARARTIAGQVELFLQGCSDDLQQLATLPANESAYLKYANFHKRKIWIRCGSPENPEEKTIPVLLYREVTFADASGIEKIHIEDGKLCPPGRNISKPFRSSFGPEDYFRKARALSESDIYVSHLIGRHIHMEEQLRGAESVELAIGGEEFNGIIRFAGPVYENGVFRGVVSLALDHRHLMEFTQHVLPFGNREVVFPRYKSGNYAFMFDDEGWMITHPKFWNIRGYDRKTGRLIDPSFPDYNVNNLKFGKLPFNLLYVPFIHINYKHIAEEVLSGKSGVTQTSSVGGISRVLAFAPIKFSFGEYGKTGFFGGVTLGAQTDVFHQAINETSGKINRVLKRLVNNFIIIIAIAGLVVSVIAFFLAKSFMRPIVMLTDKVKEISRGNYDLDIDIHSGDELEILGRNFKQMGDQLKKHEQHLIQSLKDLEKSRDEVRRYNTRLENHVGILKNIHSGSHLLTLSFDKENVFEVILKTCVNDMGFERAVLYLMNADGKTLECLKAYGFNSTAEEVIYDKTFDTQSEICLQTRVFKSGTPVLVKDVATEVGITDSDRQLAKRIGTKSIAFAPISIAGRIIGVLGADYATCMEPISREKMEFLKIVANEAAMAIERARLMDEAVKRRDFIESIFSNMMSGLLVFDFRGKVLSANPKARQFFNVTADEMAGKHIEDLLHPYPDLLNLVMENRTASGAASFCVELILQSGKHIHLEMAISSFTSESGSNEESTLLIFRDVTHNKNMENLLRRSDRLLSLGILAAGIAHEIRNPLTGISLLLDDLHDRMTNRMEERQMMQRALEEIEKLETIVTALLEFAANPASKPVRDDINRVVDDTLFFVNKQCKKQGVNLIQDKADALPAVKIDPERIKQALLNIVLNALNVLGDGGEIRITTRRVENPDVMPDQSAIELAVEDNGPGISQEDINFIFDPFFSRNPNGFGLGLSITHNIIEEHNGKIVVESEAGSGACFKIYLPVAND